MFPVGQTVSTLALFLTLVLAIGGHADVRAADDTPRASFSIQPADPGDNGIRLVAEPGSSHKLDILLSNTGSAEGEALTYAADVSSAVGGGMRIADAGTDDTGTTRWLHYPDETLIIPAGASVKRSLRIDVPQSVSAGDYHTALVIQPTRSQGTTDTGNDSVVLRTITRQAVAVTISVPGELTPAFTIGGAQASIDGPQPVIDVSVTNDGNVRVAPEGSFTLRSIEGEVLLQQPVSMGSIYPDGGTFIRVPMSSVPPPGDYRIDVELRDIHSTASASAHDIELRIEADAAASTSGSANSTPFVDRLGELAGVQSAATGGQPLWLIGGVAAAALLVGAVTLFLRRPRVVVAGIVPSERRADEWQ